MENQDRRQGDRRQSSDRRKRHITITLNTFIFSLVVAVIIILGGVFFIVRSIQNSYDDSLYYEDYDYDTEEDVDLEDEDIDGTSDNETENQNTTDGNNTSNTANETSAQ